MMSERDELLLRLSRDLAALVDTAVAAMPAASRDILDGAIRSGATLMVTAMLTPTPLFIGTLSLGPDSDPVELFRVSPGAAVMSVLSGRQAEQGH